MTILVKFTMLYKCEKNSLHARFFFLFLHFEAPGTYHIENGNMDKAPQYSFGIRTVHGTSLNTPGNENILHKNYVSIKE